MGNVTRILHRVRLAYKTIATVLAVSFILHVAVALLSSGGIVQDDAISYRDIAKNVARGNGYVFAAGQEPTAWRAPAYPMFLAGVFKLTGDSETAARVANAFLWLGTNLLITLIAFALLEPASAMLACALAAFYPEFIGFSGLLWSESLSTFLFTAALATLVLLGVSRLWIFAILAGFFSGALILSRSTFLVLLFCIVVAGFAGLLKRRQAMAVVLIALAVVTPWSVRNYRLLHCFVLVESNATQNLYMGSRPDLPIPLTIRGIQQQNDPVYLAIARMPNSERYRAFGTAAMKNIRAHPGRFALLAISKAIDFWFPDYFVARNVKAGSYGPLYSRFWPWVLAITSIAYLIVVVSATYTIIQYRRLQIVQFAFLLLITYTVPHSLIYGASKYHVPLMAVVCILAAPTLLHLTQYVRAKFLWRCRKVGGATSSFGQEFQHELVEPHFATFRRILANFGLANRSSDSYRRKIESILRRNVTGACKSGARRAA
jgi:4-amino-4-deoxy-L-arabinose transferase-like glycosyltransferase